MTKPRYLKDPAGNEIDPCDWRKVVEKQGFIVYYEWINEGGTLLAHSVGMCLKRKFMPDIAIAGMVEVEVQDYFSNLYKITKHNGFRPSYGVVQKAPSLGRSIFFDEVDPKKILALAPKLTQFYQAEMAHRLQLIYSDQNHCFPWDKGVDPDLLVQQPLLY